jgi:Phosphopantetheine attachment site
MLHVQMVQLATSPEQFASADFASRAVQDNCAMDVLFVKADKKFAYETVAIASRRAAGAYPPEKPASFGAFTSKSFDASKLFANDARSASPSPFSSPVLKSLLESESGTSVRIGTEASDAAANGAVNGAAGSPFGSADANNGAVVDEGFPITMNEIREWKSMLRLCVPEYMVPSIFMGVEALPLTQNGKIDRKALPPPSPQDLQLNHNRDAANFVPPVGTTQTQLALMWGELLHLTDVSANDDFFEAGGHSLLAMQLATSINGVFGVRLPMAKLAAHSRLDKCAPPALPAPQRTLSPACVHLIFAAVSSPESLLLWHARCATPHSRSLKCRTDVDRFTPPAGSRS